MKKINKKNKLRKGAEPHQQQSDLRGSAASTIWKIDRCALLDQERCNFNIVGSYCTVQRVVAFAVLLAEANPVFKCFHDSVFVTAQHCRMHRVEVLHLTSQIPHGTYAL
jgi:hypothetical protein